VGGEEQFLLLIFGLQDLNELLNVSQLEDDLFNLDHKLFCWHLRHQVIRLFEILVKDS
jgi:hypothetical protein